MEINKVKVFLDRQNKWFDCDIRKFDVAVGDRVIVESSKGLEAGKVVGEVEDGENNEQMIAMVRHENERDVQIEKDNIAKEIEIKEKTKR